MRTRWKLSGLLLIVFTCVIALLSHNFNGGLGNRELSSVLLTVALMAAGSIFLLSVPRMRRNTATDGAILFLLAVGLAMRLSMFGSPAFFENDQYRYLWDGAVLAHGYNPYAYAPQDIIQGAPGNVPPALHDLAVEAESIVKKINFPWLKTIYPPVAQFAFAFAYLLHPWSMDSWRLVLLLFDMATLFILYRTLKRLTISPLALAIYWWNPLLIKEAYNSGHMELVILPFVTGALLLAIQKQPFRSVGVLGIAFGAKLWPLILLPVVLRPLLKRPAKLFGALALFLTIALIMLFPFIRGGSDVQSGLLAYGTSWEMNDALFMAILWFSRLVIDLSGLAPLYAPLIARMSVVLALGAWTLWLVRRDSEDPFEISRRFLFIIAALFLLSPTQFPWYYLWMVPFLAIQPRTSLLLLTALLPMYYLREWLRSRGMIHVFDHGIVWLEFAPVWLTLLLECARASRKSTLLGPTASV